MEKVKQGMQQGAAINESLTLRHVKPALNKLGFDFEYLRDTKEKYILPEWREWSTFARRFMDHGSGMLARMWHEERPSIFKIVQILPVLNWDKVENRPRFCIPADVVAATIQENRIETTLKLLAIMDVHYLIYVCSTGAFAFGRFEDIPIEGWGMDYRGKSKEPNRIHTLPEYQLKLFYDRSKLEEVLKKYLKA